MDLMPYRDYGTTGKRVSVMGLGGMRFENHEDLDGMAAVLIAARDRGVNFFDTAPGYGNSERIVGRAVPELKKSDAPFYLSTKTFKVREPDVRRELETSLQRMNTDRIDFYHIWSVATWADWVNRRDAGVLKSFQRMKEEGLVDHVCMSVHLNGDDIVRLLPQIDGVVEGLLLGYNILNFPYRENGVRAACDAGLGVAAMNPLNGGTVLADTPRLAFIRRNARQTPLEAALAFNVGNPLVATNLVGVRNVADVHSAADAVESAPALDDAEYRRLADNTAEALDRLCTGCRYCQNDCPQSIPIAAILQGYNWYQLTGDGKDAVSRLGWQLGVTAPDAWDSCTACRRCEQACTQHLPILRCFEELKDLAGG